METKWIHIALLLELTTRVFPQSADYSGKGLTEMPPNVPLDTVELHIINNLIENFPENAFDDFYKLQSLYMGTNPFTAIPNLIAVGDTLKRLNLPNCHVTSINETIFNELKVLESLKVENCKLRFLPNVAGPGSSLSKILASGCRFGKFPAVNHYKALSKLDIGNNPMTSVQDSDVDNLEQLTTLIMNDVPLHSLPYNPKALQTLDSIDVSSSQVTTVPLTCPQQDLTLNGQDSDISLCSCENVWLKAVDGQRGSVQLDDMTCGDAATTDEILQQQCQRPEVAVREIVTSTKHQAFWCGFPAHSYVTSISKFECTLLCLDTLGCSSFSFRSTDGRLGNCAIIAPTDSALTDIPDADDAGWNYHTVADVLNV